MTQKSLAATIRAMSQNLQEKKKEDDPEIHAHSDLEKKIAKDKQPKHPYISFSDEDDEEAEDNENQVKKTGKQKSYSDAGFGEEVVDEVYTGSKKKEDKKKPHNTTLKNDLKMIQKGREKLTKNEDIEEAKKGPNHDFYTAQLKAADDYIAKQKSTESKPKTEPKKKAPRYGSPEYHKEMDKKADAFFKKLASRTNRIKRGHKSSMIGMKGISKEETEISESNRAANRQGRNQTPAMIRVRELMKKKKAGGRVTAKEFAAAKAAAQAEQEAMTKAKTVKPEPKPKPKSSEPEKAKVDDRSAKRVAQNAHRFMINHPTYRRHAANISAHITHLINTNKMPEHLLHHAAVGGHDELHALVKHAHESMKQEHERPAISLASIKIKK